MRSVENLTGGSSPAIRRDPAPFGASGPHLEKAISGNSHQIALRFSMQIPTVT
jgi:hypothetical protein